MNNDLRYLILGLVGTAFFAFLPLAVPKMRYVAIAGTALSLILAVYFGWPEICVVFGKMGIKNVRSCFILSGMLVGGILGWVAYEAFYIPPKNESVSKEKSMNDKDTKPVYSMNISHNTGIATQGQIGNNTILQQKPDRVLDDKAKNYLLSHLPDQHKPIMIRYVTGKEGEIFSNKIAAFLYLQGYKIDGIYPSVLADNPVGLEADNRSPQMAVITVGENR